MTPEQLREAVNTVRHATDTDDATAALAAHDALVAAGLRRPAMT